VRGSALDRSDPDPFVLTPPPPLPLDYADAAAGVAARRVGFFPRAGAAVVDVLLLLIALMAPYAGGYYLLETNGMLTPAWEYGMDLSLTVLALAYSTFEVFAAATPGKMLLKLRIAMADGTVADRWTLFNRWFYKNGGSVLVVIGTALGLIVIDRLGGTWNFIVAIGCLFAFQSSRQAWHDRPSGTAVYKKTDEQRRGFAPLDVRPVEA